MTEPVVVLAPNPSMFTGRGTNTYLVGEGPLLCIDPGPDDRGHLDAILGAARDRDASIATILLSHSHPDHRPLARRLAAETGAEVRCLEPRMGEDGAVPMHDGDRVHAGGVTLLAVGTPGHASDHLCFFDEATGALYSGDHILEGMTTVINPPDGDMTAYMASLDRVRALQPTVIHPGHGERVDDAVALIDDYITHRRDREEQVARVARGRGVSVRPRDLVPEIYQGYPEPLWDLAARSVEAHLDKLVHEGRAERRDRPGGREYLVR